MKLQRVIEILEKHQNWRRDHSVPAKTEMQSPIEIGTAIDYALRELKKLNIDDVSNQRKLLIAFGEWFKINGRVYDFGIDESVIDEYISNL